MLFIVLASYKSWKKAGVTGLLDGSVVKTLLTVLLNKFNVCTVFAEIFDIVLIWDVTFITKFKKVNNCICTAACWAC